MSPLNRINITNINDSNYNINSMRDGKSIKTSTNRDNKIFDLKDNIFNEYE
jgi:hypothetical protein